MPKKKLTKTQVNSKYNQIVKNMRVLILDRLDYGKQSQVPYTVKKLLDIQAQIERPFPLK